MRNHVRWRFRLRTVFTTLTVASLVFAALHFILQARKEARRQSTELNFKTISIALHQFNELCNRLPRPTHHAGGKWPFDDDHDPSAKALYSWRFSIVMFVASYRMSPVWDRPWNSPANARWRTVAQTYSANGWDDPASTDTCAFAITGPGTAFGDGKHEAPHSLDEIDDDTIIVVEIRNSGNHWMAPGDFDIRTMPNKINSADNRGISGIHKVGFHVLFADGVVWCLSYDVPYNELKKFFTIAGARANDRAIVLKPYVRR